MLRTGKSCGPDAPTLASSSRMLCRPYRARTQRWFAGDGGKRARSPGRARRKPLKPLRAGMPGDSGVLVVTRVRSTTIIAHETAGALGIRHSPRPLSGGRLINDSGALRGEVANVCLDVIASAAKQSIAPRKGRMDCFAALAMTARAMDCVAEPVIGRVFARPLVRND